MMILLWLENYRCDAYFSIFDAQQTVKSASAQKCFQLRVSLRFSAPHYEPS